MAKAHKEDKTCWCKPVMVFNTGAKYGKVYIHKSQDGLLEDPGRDTIMYAVSKALFENENVHVWEKEIN